MMKFIVSESTTPEQEVEVLDVCVQLLERGVQRGDTETVQFWLQDATFNALLNRQGTYCLSHVDASREWLAKAEVYELEHGAGSLRKLDDHYFTKLIPEVRAHLTAHDMHNYQNIFVGGKEVGEVNRSATACLTAKRAFS